MRQCLRVRPQRPGDCRPLRRWIVGELHRGLRAEHEALHRGELADRVCDMQSTSPVVGRSSVCGEGARTYGPSTTWLAARSAVPPPHSVRRSGRDRGRRRTRSWPARRAERGGDRVISRRAATRSPSQAIEPGPGTLTGGPGGGQRDWCAHRPARSARPPGGAHRAAGVPVRSRQRAHTSAALCPAASASCAAAVKWRTASRPDPSHARSPRARPRTRRRPLVPPPNGPREAVSTNDRASSKRPL